MDAGIVKLQTDVAALNERIAALELVNQTAQEKAAREAAEAAAAKEKAAQDAAAKQTFWKKKEPPAGK